MKHHLHEEILEKKLDIGDRDINETELEDSRRTNKAVSLFELPGFMSKKN